MSASQYRDEVERLVRQHLGPVIEPEILGGLFQSYAAAAAHAKEFDAEAQRRKVYAMDRLANIESCFKVIAQKFPDRLKAEDVPTKHGGYYYLALRAGPIILTCSAVPAPNVLPRKSHYRETLAYGLQHDLFRDVAAVQGRRFWHVLLLHNYKRVLVTDPTTGDPRIKRFRKAPAFAHLLVPTRDGLGTIWSTSLFEDYPEAIARLKGIARETVTEDQVKRPLRKRQRERGTGEAS